MDKQNTILIGGTSGGKQVHLNLPMANRHGLIAGATGTGKTVTLQILAEGFSKQGIPVFTADVKGDLAGLSQTGIPHPKVDERVEKIKIDDYKQQPSPVVFWDLYGETGHPIRTTVSEMGPLLLSRLLHLNDTQDAVLHLIFKIADDGGMLILDLKDLRALLNHVSNKSKELRAEYGNIPTQTVGTIQRQLIVLEESGGDVFFGEPALKLDHIMKKDFSGRGIINILDARKLMIDPRIYSTFLLWLLSELFEQLPEVGDSDKPKLIFFFDESHLLFDDAPALLLQKIEQVARLIRSKGVGVYFVSQSPLDIPETVRGQLGNRIQHAMRAFTPRDQKAVKSAAETFRANKKFKTDKAITELEVGEGLVSVLDIKGRPTEVERTLVRPPESRMSAITQVERTSTVSSSPLAGIYDMAVDRESAYEMLKKQASAQTKGQQEKTKNTYYNDYAKEQDPKQSQGKAPSKIGSILDGLKTGKRQSYAETFIKQAARSVGSKIANEVMRGVLGSLK